MSKRDSTTDAGAGALDRFLPEPDIRERHHVRVRAPAEVVYREAMAFDFESLLLVRALLRGREILMGGKLALPGERLGFAAKMRSIGWELLAEEPGRLHVAGAVCQPWQPDVVFTPVAPEAFAKYAEPDQVKIAWTIETAPQGPEDSLLLTETRAAATDAEARRKFLPYFRRLRPGIVAIRWLLLGAIRRRAEAAWRDR